MAHHSLTFRLDEHDYMLQDPFAGCGIYANQQCMSSLRRPWWKKLWPAGKEVVIASFPLETAITTEASAIISSPGLGSVYQSQLNKGVQNLELHPCKSLLRGISRWVRMAASSLEPDARQINVKVLSRSHKNLLEINLL